MKQKIIVCLVILLLTGCSFIPKLTVVQSQAPASIQETIPVELDLPAPTEDLPGAVITDQPVSTLTPSVTPTLVPSLTGPDEYSDDINPLTGLKVQNPEMLAYPPALVSITNFPLSARPQAGLSYAPIIYELFIGEGMSRFLALFYGDFPGQENGNSGVISENNMIGPVRSGRLPYETLRSLYRGYLVMASAYSGVAANLSSYTNLFGSDQSDVNSAMIQVSQLEEITKKQSILKGDQPLQGNMFDVAIPQDGAKAERLVYFYSKLNQIYWQYDKKSGTYHRFQDNSDGTTFTELTDKLTESPLEIENVVVLFANHSYCNETVLDIDLLGIKHHPALLFRDGQVFSIFWTTYGEEYEQTTGLLRPIRFVDAEGNPFPLKPGQTWVHLTPLNTPVWESIDSTVMFDYLNKPEPGSGNWVVRFYADLMQYDVEVCNKVLVKK